MADNNEGDNSLPPGFRFYPSDEDLVVHFLRRKDHDHSSILPFHPRVIPDLDLYPYNPWELQGKALEEGDKWYYYSRKIQNRVTESGYWNPMGMDEPIISSSSKKIVGMKKYYVFHIGEPPAGVWTSWIMHEYRLPDSGSTSRSTSRKTRGHPKLDYNKWVICKVYEQRNDDDDGDNDTELSCLDEVFLSMDDLDEISLPN
ncbi:NAC domain-containing protein 104-like [Amaranthus tricolor]|uniref:NAC domain-containing protein 104-like n=1 Tax=Amaranthus tricolor TaxID=29722 RepID=UPI00258504A4|nr:NAC domain-containing protein 104-like [Amaranthus tricolor]